jgi:hypothetical protein
MKGKKNLRKKKKKKKKEKVSDLNVKSHNYTAFIKSH